jgi:ABC-2 type transport system permease protein
MQPERNITRSSRRAGPLGDDCYLIPLRYFLVILRGIFLKGVGLETFWPDALALLAWGLAILTLATLRSSKRLA